MGASTRGSDPRAGGAARTGRHGDDARQLGARGQSEQGGTAAPVEEIDHAALIRQAHGEAAEQDQASKDLPPIEYDQKRPGASRNLTPAEEAAAGLDPIEELISQIMVDDSGRRAAPAPAPRAGTA